MRFITALLILAGGPATQAAELDGAGPFRRFFSITLPISQGVGPLCDHACVNCNTITGIQTLDVL